MNENTFLSLGNNNRTSQPMGMGPMGGDVSSMPMGDPSMAGMSQMPGTDPDDGVAGEQGADGMDPSLMGDDQNEPVMGANAFDDGSDADVSGDPEKKAESLAGQLASLFRKDLSNDGINKHEDKKKEVLGMIASAIVDGMSEEDRNSMVEYLSDKLNGAGESDGDKDDDSQDTGEGDLDMADGNEGMGDGTDMGGGDSQQMAESRVNEVVNDIVREFIGNDLTRKKKPANAAKVDQEGKKQGYKSAPYMAKK